ncbi:hypothetical protein DPMN_052086 [Dreissena polymorpha]|uniref:Uncharacterized protein n=1 Tax=Dreissena polymorpha TaxID=45954 RepID=A0A9D4CJ15_DREPO|nr:hypothetical protein DPMN_052086 [Dreissena polymorpha]
MDWILLHIELLARPMKGGNLHSAPHSDLCQHRSCGRHHNQLAISLTKHYLQTIRHT